MSIERDSTLLALQRSAMSTNLSVLKKINMLPKTLHTGKQNATCILSTDMIHYLNQFGWHYEADRTARLPPSHLRSRIMD